MKEIRVALEDKEYDKLMKDKKALTWKQYLMRVDLQMANIKVICRKCEQEMLSESTSDNNTINIYLCSRCKYEVKVISIGDK